MDPQTIRALTQRFGSFAVEQWVASAELVARMAFDSMVAISGAAGKPAAPEAIGVVFRYANDTPDGFCCTIGVSPAGPMATAEKGALLERAAVCLSEHDVLQVQSAAPPHASPGPQILGPAGIPVDRDSISGALEAPEALESPEASAEVPEAPESSEVPEVGAPADLDAWGKPLSP